MEKHFKRGRLRSRAKKTHVDENCERFENPCGMNYNADHFKQSPKAFT